MVYADDAFAICDSENSNHKIKTKKGDKDKQEHQENKCLKPNPFALIIRFCCQKRHVNRCFLLFSSVELIKKRSAFNNWIQLISVFWTMTKTQVMIADFYRYPYMYIIQKLDPYRTKNRFKSSSTGRI